MLLDPLQARAVFLYALEQRFALLAVNADSPAAVTDVLEAARPEQAPVIIEASLWQLTGQSFGAGDPGLGLARYLVQIALLANSERFRDIPVLFHTDHIKGPVTLPLLRSAIRGLPTGVESTVVSPSTISLDSSGMNEAENFGALCDLGETARACGRPVTLEMEAGVDDGITPLDVTERLLGAVESRIPGQLALWAPGVGTQHGLGEQTAFSARAVEQHQKRASEVTGRPLGIALHGSSGLSEAGLQDAVRAGVVKVNWSSESLLLRSQAAQEFYGGHAAALRKGHPDWKATAMDHGVQRYVSERYLPQVRDRIRLLGGSGRAPACLAQLRNLV
jgi:fructose-bisphosphate aldolase, class II